MIPKVKTSNFRLGIAGSLSSCSSILVSDTGEFFETHYQRTPGLHFREMKQDVLHHSLEQLCINVLNKASKNINLSVSEIIDRLEFIVLTVAGLDERFDPTLMIGPLAQIAPFTKDDKSSKIDDIDIMYRPISEACYCGALQDKPGIFIRIGIGCSVFGRDSYGNKHLSCAWGFLPGDLGGGYFIGQQVLHKLTRYCDNRANDKEIEFSQKALDLLGNVDITDIYDKYRQMAIISQHKNMIAISELSRIAFTIASNKDSIAYSILRRSANEIIDGIRAVEKTLNFKEESIPIIFGGSLVKQYPEYAKYIYKKVKNICPKIVRIDRDFLCNRTIGLGLLTLGNLKKDKALVLTKPCHTFLNSLDDNEELRMKFCHDPNVIKGVC